MMTKKDTPRSEILHMRGTIIIDLDAVRAIHEKLLEYEFSKVTYQFSIDNDEYQCACVDEIAMDVKEKRLTKIDNLEIVGLDEKERRICVSLKTDLLSQTCTIRQSHQNAVLRCLANEILKILKEQNLFVFKNVVARLFSLEKRMLWFVSINLVVFFGRYALVDQWRRLADIYLIFVFIPTMIAMALPYRKFTVRILIEDASKTSFFRKYNVADKIVNAVIMALIGLAFKIFSSG